MTVALLPETLCGHPDDRRGPLPYDGKPPRGDEWECLDCGMWHVAEPTIGVTDLSVTIGVRVDSFAKSLSDLEERVLKNLRGTMVMPYIDPLPAAFDPASFTFDASSASEVLRSAGATYKVEASGVVVISLDVTGDVESKMVERVSNSLAVKRSVRADELQVSMKIADYDYLEEYDVLDRVTSRCAHDKTTVEVSNKTWRELRRVYEFRDVGLRLPTTLLGRSLVVSRDVPDDHLVFVFGS